MNFIFSFSVNNKCNSCIIMRRKKYISRARFRSSDLWVMGPARFHCATLLIFKHSVWEPYKVYSMQRKA